MTQRIQAELHHINNPMDPEYVDRSINEELRLFDFTHYPVPGKETNTTRIFYNNINGLEINAAIATAAHNKKQQRDNDFLKDLESYTKLEAFVKQMYDWQTDISILAEPCIEWRDVIPRTIVRETSKKYERNGHWNVATSKCYSGSFVKPGGALIYSSGSIVGRIEEKGTDPWGYGRWSHVKYRGQGNRSLLVIGGYRVGHRSTVPGASTAWYQQKVLLTQDNRSCEPEDAFLIDLEEWLHKVTDGNTEILLALDANEKWATNSKITEFAKKVGLFNLNLAGEYNFPASHPCMTNRNRDTTIDFCLCSQQVLKAIKYATMTPYDLHRLGDHRGLLIDLDIKQLLTSENDTFTVPIGRKLSMNNPKATEKYLEMVERRFTEQNIFNRAKQLMYHWKKKRYTRWTIMKKYEKLDKEVFTICRKAEQKCKPTVSGDRQWSPKLSRMILELSYWRARSKYSNENTLIKKIGDELDILYEIQDPQEIQTKILYCRENLRLIQKDSIQHRQLHLETLAEAYAASNNLKKMTAIKELISHESKKRMFTILQDKMKQKTNGQLKQVWLSYNSEGEYTKDHATKTILQKDSEVHKALLQRNQKHLEQARHTPFATGSLANRLKWDGTGDLGSDILSGEILNKARFDTTVQLYFECLQTARMTNISHLVKPTLTLQEYKTFWKKKKEETATSPFGLHVGHYKAAIKKEEILNVHRILLLLPFQTAMVPHRWKKTVQTMIEKDPGHPWIHRLRIIELFDAQVNAGFQIFIGRQMVWNAVNRQQLHPASFGSTPGKMAASALLQKILCIDQLKIERRAGGIFDCDATGCYDRILPPLATVHLRALGLDSSIATFLARLMFTAKRYVKTQHGVSVNSIRTTREHPLFGIGQGNGGGPAIWLAHLTVMFTALAAICQGFIVHCVEGITHLITVGTGYVDDVTLFVTLENTEQQTERHVKRKIKFMATQWERLLFLTGGKLELTKCFWMPITWAWKKGDPILSRSRSGGVELHLKESESGQRVLIPRIKGSDVEKRLGVRYSIDGSWKGEYTFWIHYSTDFVTKLRKARLDRIAGEHAYKTLWCSKFRYCAPVVSFTPKQLIKIQQKVIGPSLTAAGFNSKMPRAVVFGPTKLGGMRWDSPYSISLYTQISMLIGSVRLNDTVGQLFKLQLKWLQILAGIQTPLLESNRVIPYLPNSWIQLLHEKMVQADIQIRTNGTWTPSLRREDDQIIMDYVCRKLPEPMWNSINQCRLFLQALTFADISTFDGTTVPRQILNVKKKYRPSHLLFPRQKRPAKQARQHWRYFMQFIADQHGRFHVPLGRWIDTPYQLFPYSVTSDNNIMYVAGEGQWRLFYKVVGTRNRFHDAGISRSTLPKQ